MRTAAVLTVYLLRSALEIAAPFLLGQTVGTLEHRVGAGGALPYDFVQSLWLLAAVYAAKNVCQYVASVAAASLGQDIENRLRSELFDKVARLRFRWHDENRSGKTIARSLRDMEKAKNFFREVAFGYVEMGLLVLGTLVASFGMHWTYGVSVGSIVVLAFAITGWVGARIGRMDRATSDFYDKVTTVLQENVAGARVVRAFGQQPSESEKFGGRLGAFSDSWRRLALFWTTIMPIVGHGFVMVVPVALMVGAWRLVSGEGSLGEVLAILLYVRTVRDRLRPLTRLVILGQEAVASAARVFEVIDRNDVIVPPPNPAALPESGGGRLVGDLKIEDVWFSYPGGKAVLRGVSLHVPPGGSIGILGPTGSGKSTLMHLLPRFYDPDKGRIVLDGTDIQRLAPEDLSRAVGLVFQEPFLFSATVAENIAYGRPDISRERIEECARLAAAHEFIVGTPGVTPGLPKGYDTIIGERGVSLSGGQRQRLTIARALAMDPRVLIFDDATASVDAVTERELFQGIRAAARGRTTLVISQRVTSVAWCDRVAVLEGGVLTAVGTHDDLMRESALYREIHRHQTLERVMA